MVEDTSEGSVQEREDGAVLQIGGAVAGTGAGKADTGRDGQV